MAKSKKKFSINDAKKYSIWVAIPVAILVALVVKTMAVGKIEKDFETTKSELEGAKSTVQKIASDMGQPNQKTIDEINQHSRVLYFDIFNAWGYLEKDQKEKNRWPIVLGTDFVTKVESLKPGEQLGVLDCERYRNFITDHLPTMIMSVDIRKTEIRRYDPRTGLPAQDAEGNEIWDIDDTSYPSLKNTSATGASVSAGGYGSQESSGGSNFGGYGGGGGNQGLGTVGSSGSSIEAVNPDIRRTGKVDWASPEIFSLVSNLGQDRLNSVQIWCTQEDFWVYDALLWVVKKANEGAKGQYDAPVKRIENILIGQKASPLLATLDKTIGSFSATSATSSSSDSSSTPSSTDSSDGSSSSLGGTAGPGLTATPEQWRTFLINNRYVDLANKPLLASATPPFKEFNRMPICLRLIVDQQRIPDILVNCANCRMPIDIIQVRVNPGRGKSFTLSSYTATTGSSGSSSTGGGGDSGGESSGLGGTYGPGDGTTGGGEYSSTSGTTSYLGGSVDDTGNDVFLVEIYGIINIFNSSQHSLQEMMNNPNNKSTDFDSGSDEGGQETSTGSTETSTPAGATATPEGTTPDPDLLNVENLDE